MVCFNDNPKTDAVAEEQVSSFFAEAREVGIN